MLLESAFKSGKDKYELFFWTSNMHTKALASEIYLDRSVLYSDYLVKISPGTVCTQCFEGTDCNCIVVGYFMCSLRSSGTDSNSCRSKSDIIIFLLFFIRKWLEGHR